MSLKKKERLSETSNISELGETSTPFVSPESSPLLEGQKINFNIPLINNNNNNTNSSDTDEELDNIVLNLKILSKLKENYKLNVNDKNLSIDSSYIPSITRYFSDDSRNGTIIFLENLDKLIKNKIEKIVEENSNNNMFLNSKENILLQISHNLTMSLVGLNNLIKTYNNDELITSKLEMVINSFDLKIKKIANILKLNK